MDRIILHCDCNAFFASVELLNHPELAALPVAVGRDDDSRHGIVLAKNEAAKKFGIQTAETLWQAKRKCPGLIILPPHHDRYVAYSKQLNAIYGDYTDLVEPFGIDESWLDVTGSLHLFAATGVQLADRIRARVKAQLGLTISVGVSFNKIYAKLGSDYKKPDATTLISRENCAALVGPLPVESMIFVGHAAQQTLAGMGITTLGQLAAADENRLADAFGKLGAQLRRNAAGENTDPVAPQNAPEEVKSVGNGITFRRSLTTAADLRTGCAYLTDEVAARLRAHGLLCQVVQVQIKGDDLKSISRQKRLPRETDLSAELAQAACRLVQDNWPAGRPIRALTVTAQQLVTEPAPVQMSLTGPPPQLPDEKTEKLERTLDSLRSRYGQAAPGRGSLMGNDLGLSDFSRPHRPPAEKDPGKDEDLPF